MSFHETMDAFDNVRHSTKMASEFYIEGDAYQMAAVEEMERRAFAVNAMHPIKDKRSRLRVAARYIKNCTVKFPCRGCEELLNQLFGFGAEKHDDLVDALVWLILGVAGDGRGTESSLRLANLDKTQLRSLYVLISCCFLWMVGYVADGNYWFVGGHRGGPGQIF
jgi:hypothetical protein